ncbi:hypothetical protein [Amycolatopsis sp. H20-H5]|uniref:hypothetical protein n=1 Tax=Amycolatopsis sp. H20-H5 TaxID=3046309 RepID=UPI002DBCB269|nr:hypothetical protein [Amycolatopsis sp. H20-H5]MEC3982504.1 hypothetical protein [Amycolatopsis sp. H20-H5]
MLVAADIARAALPGMPLWSLCVLVAVATPLNGPFKAAQQAMLPDVLTGERYTVGMVIRHITIRTAQLAGFAGGGCSSPLTPSAGLAIDAATSASPRRCCGAGSAPVADVYCLRRPGLAVSTLLVRAVRHGLLHPGQGVVRPATPGRTARAAPGRSPPARPTVQRLGALLAGVPADQIGPAHTIAVAGLAGAVVAIPIAVGWSRARLARAPVDG